MPKALDLPFKWNDAAKETALNLVFEGRLTQAEIAQKCGIAPRTLAYWLIHPGFKERLQEKRASLEKALDGVIYADKARRVIALDQMAAAARDEFEHHPWLQEKRQIGFDKEREEPLYLINESFNRDAFESFRGALDDIAKELGQRKSSDTHVQVQQNQVLFVVPEKTHESVAQIILDHLAPSVPLSDE